MPAQKSTSHGVWQKKARMVYLTLFIISSFSKRCVWVTQICNHESIIKKTNIIHMSLLLACIVRLSEHTWLRTPPLIKGETVLLWSQWRGWLHQSGVWWSWELTAWHHVTQARDWPQW